MALVGTSGGQDAAKRAALIRYAGGQGATTPKATPQGAPSPAAGGGDVTQGLLDLAHQTVADKNNYQANLGAWKAALSFLAANLPPEVLQSMQGGQQGAGPQEPISPAMGQGAAQGAPSMYARPPR